MTKNRPASYISILPVRRRAPFPCGRRSDRKSTRLNSSRSQISYAVFCLKKKKKIACVYFALVFLFMFPHVIPLLTMASPVFIMVVAPQTEDYYGLLFLAIGFLLSLAVGT